MAASAQGSDSGVHTTTAPVAVPATAAAGVPATAVASVGKCEPVNLAFALGDSRQTGQDQRTQVVDMTNHASSACTMDGFPGVDVLGAANSQPSYDWNLTRSSTNGHREGDSAAWRDRALRPLGSVRGVCGNGDRVSRRRRLSLLLLGVGPLLVGRPCVGCS